jgi:hypothetical protein
MRQEAPRDLLDDCERLANSLMGRDITSEWWVAVARIAPAADPTTVIFECKLEPRSPGRNCSSLRTFQLEITELHDLLRDPSHLVPLFAHPRDRVGLNVCPSAYS